MGRRSPKRDQAREIREKSRGRKSIKELAEELMDCHASVRDQRKSLWDAGS